MTAAGGKHLRVMEAAEYWRQYEVRWTWDKPYDPVTGDGELVGYVEALRETRSSPKDPWVARLAIRRHPDGVLCIVDAYQQRLLAELVLAAPAVGDKIRIRYLGPEQKAAPGKQPVKRFSVEVWRQDSQSPGGTEHKGEVLSENDPETGK